MTSHAASPAVKMLNIGWKDSPQSPDPPEVRAYTLPRQILNAPIVHSCIADIEFRLREIAPRPGHRLTRSYFGPGFALREVRISAKARKLSSGGPPPAGRLSPPSWHQTW